LLAGRKSIVLSDLASPPTPEESVDFLRNRHLCVDEGAYAEGKHLRIETASAVLSQTLNPDVLMMKSAEDWYRCNSAELVRAPKIRRILVQREMRPDLVVIGSIILICRYRLLP